MIDQFLAAYDLGSRFITFLFVIDQS